MNIDNTNKEGEIIKGTKQNQAKKYSNKKISSIFEKAEESLNLKLVDQLKLSSLRSRKGRKRMKKNEQSLRGLWTPLTY